MTHGTWPQQRKGQHLSPSDVVEIDPVFLPLIRFAPKHSLCSSKMRTVGVAQFFGQMFNLYFFTENALGWEEGT